MSLRSFLSAVFLSDLEIQRGVVKALLPVFYVALSPNNNNNTPFSALRGKGEVGGLGGGGGAVEFFRGMMGFLCGSVWGPCCCNSFSSFLSSSSFSSCSSAPFALSSFSSVSMVSSPSSFLSFSSPSFLFSSLSFLSSPVVGGVVKVLGEYVRTTNDDLSLLPPSSLLPLLLFVVSHLPPPPREGGREEKGAGGREEEEGVVELSVSLLSSLFSRPSLHPLLVGLVKEDKERNGGGEGGDGGSWLFRLLLWMSHVNSLASSSFSPSPSPSLSIPKTEAEEWFGGREGGWEWGKERREEEGECVRATPTERGGKGGVRRVYLRLLEFVKVLVGLVGGKKGGVGDYGASVCAKVLQLKLSIFFFSFFSFFFFFLFPFSFFFFSLFF